MAQVARRVTSGPAIAELGIGPVPKLACDDRSMLAGIMRLLVAHLAKVNPISEQMGEAATGEGNPAARTITRPFSRRPERKARMLCGCQAVAAVNSSAVALEILGRAFCDVG